MVTPGTKSWYLQQDLVCVIKPYVFPGHDLPGALGVEVVVVDAHALALLAGPVPALQVTMNMRQGQPAVDPQDMMITVAEVNPQHSRDAHVLDHKWRSQTNERCLVL